MDRIALLQSFVARSPDDPFPRYGLAMELVQQGRQDEGLAAFAELVARIPAYLPAYLMYGNALAAAGQTDAAADIYRRGIALAQELRDGKTTGELEAALAAVGG
jgi:tetratricopeptide (TPR) repeat protein